MSTLTHVLEREKNVGKMSTFKRLVWKIKKISLPSLLLLLSGNDPVVLWHGIVAKKQELAT